MSFDGDRLYPFLVLVNGLYDFRKYYELRNTIVLNEIKLLF